MKKFKVIIRELLEEKVEVLAESPSDAISKVEDKYYACDIILSADNHTQTDITLSIKDKLCKGYLKNPLFCSFVDTKLKQKLPELDIEEKMKLTFGSVNNAISHFENQGGEPGKED